MEFLNTTGLYALGLLPLLVIPYLIRRKPRRIRFSSLLLLRELSTPADSRSWRRIRLPVLFFLQLLFLALVLLSLADPVLRRENSVKIALVLDNSASMQAREGDTTRLLKAQEELKRVLGGVSAGARIDFYVTAPWLGLVGADLSPTRALRLLEQIKAYDVGDGAYDAGERVRDLLQEERYRELVFVTDRPVRGQAGADVLRLITVGTPQDNLAITGFDVSRRFTDSARGTANIEVTNFTAADQEIKLVVKGGGKVLATLVKRLPARRSAAAAVEDLPPAPYYEAHIDTDDALNLDNRRFSVLSNSRGYSVFAVSPRADQVQSLRAIPGLDLKVVAPEAYETKISDESSLEIFHLSAPARLPQKNTLFILPPADNPAVTVAEPLVKPVAAAWQEPHPLSRYVTFSLFRPGWARPIYPKFPAEAVIESPGGPLVLAFEHQGRRYVVLGFDPLPFLGRKNLPMSVFTLNVLDWLKTGPRSENKSTLDLLNIAGEVRKGLPMPAGQEKALPALFQGVYERKEGAERELVAINFDDPIESDLASPTPVVIGEVASGTRKAASSIALWPYAVMVGVLLLLLEWFCNRPVGGWPYLKRGTSRS